MRRLFLDANVLFAAAASPNGGSARVLELCQGGFAQAIVSHLVLLEAARNIRGKLPPAAYRQFHRLCLRVPLEVRPPPQTATVRRLLALINEKDAPVLAAALEGRAEVLLTLDRQFMTDRIRRAQLPLQIFTPGEWLRQLIESPTSL